MKIKADLEKEINLGVIAHLTNANAYKMFTDEFTRKHLGLARSTWIARGVADL